MKFNIFSKKQEQIFKQENASSSEAVLPPKANSDYLQKELKFGSLVFYGFMDIMPNPDPVLKKMGYGYDVSIYKDLLADPQLYGAIENNRKPGVTSLLRYLDNEKCPKQELEFFQTFFNELDDKGIYNNITNQTLDTPQFGRTVFGLQWGKVNGIFIPVKISQIPANECAFNGKSELLVMNEFGFYEIPEHPARYIVLQHKATLDNPYGEPLLSRCYWNIRFKKDGMKLWALFTEKFGMPWVKANYNASAIANAFNISPTDAANMLLEQLSAMAKDGIIVFPDGTSVDIASSGQKDNSEIYEKMVRICDEQNTKLQLGHSGATESTSGDKLSNDTTATDVRQNVIDSDKMYPIMFWNKIIDWIHFFNFCGNEKPRFDLYAKEDVDMSWAERDAKLVPVFTLAGLKPTPEYLKKTYGFEDGDIELIDTSIKEENEVILPEKQTEEKPVEEEVEETEEEKTAKDLQIDKFRMLAHSLIHKFFNANAIEEYPDQQLIDNQADNAVDNDIFENTIVSFIAKKMENFNSYEEAEKNIPNLLSKIDTKEFEDYLTQILFAADMVGRLSVKDEVGNG